MSEAALDDVNGKVALLVSSPPGLTLRDYFAAKAMQGCAASDPEGVVAPENMAAYAYKVAAAMMKERESDE